MSESLRDQLLQAGFAAPSETPRKQGPGSGQRSGQRSGQNSGKRSGKRSGTGAGRPPGQSAQDNRQQVKAQSRRQSAGSQPRQHGAAVAAGTAASAQQAEEIARRKVVKAQIKTLVESVGIREIQGDSVYRFMLNKRIRELHVKEEIRAQLVDGTLLITRLNGSTWVIPADSATQILELNPNWVVVTPAADNQEDSDEYGDYPVPDDLQW